MATPRLAQLRGIQAAFRHLDGFLEYALRLAQANDHNPAHTMRGLVIMDDEVEAYLMQEPLTGLWNGVEPRPALFQPLPDDDLAHLMRLFSLDVLDLNIFLLALAPQIDRRYERIYAYLQDDVSQKFASVQLLLNLIGADFDGRFAVWERLAPTAPLRKHHLLTIPPNEAAQLVTIVKAPQRLIGYLVGQHLLPQVIAPAIQLETVRGVPHLRDARLHEFSKRLTRDAMVYLRGDRANVQQAIATILQSATDLPVLRCDLRALQGESTEHLLPLVLREGRLRASALWLDSCDVHPFDDEIWNAIEAYPLPIFFSSERPWEPQGQRQRHIWRYTLDMLDAPAQLQLWRWALETRDSQMPPENLQELASQFRFTHQQIANAVSIAIDHAVTRGDQLSVADLFIGARAQSRLDLGDLAQALQSNVVWDDLVLPPDPLQQLRELYGRVRFAHRVQQEWGFGERINPRSGVKVLFAGESGTGKTLAAQVLANDLGMMIYRIDLSMVVSKYIGETEKNLRAIFTGAMNANAVLFFDEADALFGKRSDVKDSHDRYANIETAYLLQQFEQFDGIAILATNLRQNMDQAFTRRLDFVIDFPFPEPPYRLLLWKKHFPPQAPLSDDIDFEGLARRYELAGGNIRNAAVAAAYLAAADDEPISAKHIQQAIRREHQKMGRLVD